MRGKVFFINLSYRWISEFRSCLLCCEMFQYWGNTQIKLSILTIFKCTVHRAKHTHSVCISSPELVSSCRTEILCPLSILPLVILAVWKGFWFYLWTFYYLSIALMWPHKVVHDIFPILHTHCSQEVHCRGVNLLSDCHKACWQHEMQVCLSPYMVGITFLWMIFILFYRFNEGRHLW